LVLGCWPTANDQRLTTALKERLQQLRTLARQHTAADFHLMVQLRVVKHLQHRMDGARLGVVGAIYQAPQPRVY